MFLCCSVDPSEEAVPRLVAHFQSVIDAILAGTWKHYKSTRSRRGAGRFVHDRQQLEEKLTLDQSPHCFLLQPLSLRSRLTEARDNMVNSFRRFDFKLYSPVLANVFGAEETANPGSGIDEIFPPRPAGRPRRQRLEIKDGDKLVSIAQIIFQVYDHKTNRPHVLTTRPGKEPPCWVPMDQLSPTTLDWWNKQKELQFPLSISNWTLPLYV